MRPAADLVAHVTERRFGYSRTNCTQRLQQHKLLANAGFDAAI